MIEKREHFRTRLIFYFLTCLHFIFTVVDVISCAFHQRMSSNRKSADAINILKGLKMEKVNFCNKKKIREKVEEMGGFYYQLPCKNVIQQKFGLLLLLQGLRLQRKST